MKTKIVTSVIATAAVGFFAFFSNVPKKVVKNKSKTFKNRRTAPLDPFNDESNDLFI